MPVATFPLLNTESDTKTTNGIGFNNEWKGGGVLQHGTHKSGNPQKPYLRFEDLNIPPTSVINSASITVEQITTVDVGSMAAAVGRIDKDGIWNATVNLDQWRGPSISVNDWHVELLDVATQLVITGPAASARSGGIDLEGDNGVGLKRAGQGVTILVAGDITIARVSLGGPFTGPSGNVWVEIYSDNAGLPDVLLGTSATRPVTDIAPKLFAEVRPTYDFAFSGGDVVTVAVTDIIHVVMREDQGAGQIGVHLGTANYSYAGGDLSAFGESELGGYTQQNYLTTDDLDAIPITSVGLLWSITITLGLKTTPDLSVMVQDAIDAAGYLYTDPMGFRLGRIGAGVSLGHASFDSVSSQSPELTIDWTEPALLTIPDVVGLVQAAAELSIITEGFTVGAVTFANSDTVPAGVVISQNPVGGTTAAPFTLVDIVVSLGPAPADDKLADPWTGPNRFIEPFDRGYYIWKYGKPRVDVPRETLAAEPDVDLQIYIDELAEGLAAGRAEELVDKLEAHQEDRFAMIALLEQNLVDAKDALEANRQRRRNNQAAIAVASHLLN